MLSQGHVLALVTSCSSIVLYECFLVQIALLIQIIWHRGSSQLSSLIVLSWIRKRRETGHADVPNCRCWVWYTPLPPCVGTAWQRKMNILTTVNHQPLNHAWLNYKLDNDILTHLIFTSHAIMWQFSVNRSERSTHFKTFPLSKSAGRVTWLRNLWKTSWDVVFIWYWLIL